MTTVIKLSSFSIIQFHRQKAAVVRIIIKEPFYRRPALIQPMRTFLIRLALKRRCCFLYRCIWSIKGILRTASITSAGIPVVVLLNTWFLSVESKYNLQCRRTLQAGIILFIFIISMQCKTAHASRLFFLFLLISCYSQCSSYGKSICDGNM